MGCGWFSRGATVLAVAALLGASAAFAATPEQIYRDFSDNNRLDAQYATADLEAALDSTIAQEYPEGETETQARPAIQRQIAAQQQLGEAVERGGLPFTGLDLALLTAGALFLVAFGFSLRRLAKAKQK